MVELRHTVPVDAMRARYFHRIAAELKAKGVQLVVLIPPPRGVTMARHIWPGDPSAARFDPVREEAGYRMSLRRIAQGGSIVPDILAAMRDPRAQRLAFPGGEFFSGDFHRSEEHTSELQSLMRISYAVFCFKTKTTRTHTRTSTHP